MLVLPWPMELKDILCSVPVLRIGRKSLSSTCGEFQIVTLMQVRTRTNGVRWRGVNITSLVVMLAESSLNVAFVSACVWSL